MSCERYADQVIDHACGAPLEAAAAAHLAACAACQAVVAEHREILAQAEADLKDALSLTPSPDFAARLSARLVPVRPRPAWTSPRWLGAAAAVAALLVAGVLVGTNLRDDRTGTSRRASAIAHRTPSPDVHLRPEVRPPSPAVAHAPSIDRRLGHTGTPRAAAAVRPERGTFDVVVPADQLRALERLDQLVRAGVLDESTLPAQNAGTAELVVAPLVIPELTVRDINMPAASPDSTGREPFAKE